MTTPHILCRLGLHRWKYGYDLTVDAFGWFKQCQRCNTCLSGVKVMKEAQQ